jgi:hypothetical protein
MKASLRWLLFLTAVSALAAGATTITMGGIGEAQGQPSIGVDMDPTGNTATSLGPIDSCISVKEGDTFQVDIYVKDVVELLAWETYFRFDPSVVTIVDSDVQMFLASAPGSDVLDASEGLPDIDNLHRLAAADLALPHAPDSGSGVLARLTLKAVGSGISPADVGGIDVDGDGRLDLGPLLSDNSGEKIGPLGPEGFFAGAIANGTIAVDTPCANATPPATPAVTTTTTPASPSPPVAGTPGPETPGVSPISETPAAATPRPTATPTATATAVNAGSSENGDSTWTSGPAIIGYVAGGLGALLLAGIGLLSLRRSRIR